jgi:nicotinamide phosphoribosyltransferase
MRDDMRFAMKANAIDFGDGWVDVQKKPATDPLKASKAGRQAVISIDGELESVREDALEQLTGEVNLLEVVWSNGQFVREHTWEEVTERAHKELQNFTDTVMKRSEEQAEAAE